MYQETTYPSEKTTLRLSALRWFLVTIIFTALSVALPWITHQFNLAGPTFLPMHFFVLIAGLLAGWRVGLCVGVVTPLISFELSGMPPLNLLPIILIEVAIYGLAAGILREKLKLNLWLALIGAMIIGRIFLGLAAVIFSVKIGAIAYLINAVTVGWIGIAIQLVLVPLIVNRLYHYLKK